MMPNAEAFSVCGEFDVKLMQTNIGGSSNNNKFYILQCLAGQGQYSVLFRWGRLGEPGQSKVRVGDDG
jgi:predicted DNA-binding WGR domain protein